MKQDIAELRDALERFRDFPLPSTDPEYESAVSAANDLLVAYEQVDMGTLPEDVVKLFRAAALYGGAPLDLLTPDVLAWLSEHKMADSVRVHLSRDQ